MLALTEFDLWLTVEVDDDDSVDHSLIELAEDTLGDRLVEDFKNVESFELPARLLHFGTILDGVVIVEWEEEELHILDSFFNLIKFKEDLLILSDEALVQLSSEEQDVLNSVLLEAGEQEEDFEDSLGLGKIFLASPKAGVFDTAVPLPIELNRKHEQENFFYFDEANQ